MNDESLVCRIEEWKEDMGFIILPEDQRKISGNPTTQAIFTALVRHTRSEEIVKYAKYVSLHQKILALPGQKKNYKENDRQYQLMKRRNKLKEQLKQKEYELGEKRKEYMMLVKEIKQLLQEAQRMDSILNEANKKIFYILWNKQVLDDTLKHWHSLRKNVSEVKEIQKGKRKKQSSENFGVQEAVDSCLAYISDLQKKVQVQQEQVQYGSDGTSTAEAAWKQEIVNYVTEKMKGFPWHTVFEILLSQQSQLIKNIQYMLSNNTFNAENAQSRTIEVEKQMLKLEMISYESSPCADNVNSDLYVKPMGGKENGNLQITQLNKLSNSTSQKTEEMKMLENHLHDIDHCIHEKGNECKAIKSQLRARLAQVSRLILQIKQFQKRSQTLQKEGVKPALHLDELHTSMQHLCAAGPEEIRHFADIPLVALEKMTSPNGKRVPVYELMSSYHKVLCNSGKYSCAFFPVMQDAYSLAPHDLLLLVWKQLSYLGMLHESQRYIKPFVGTNMNMDVPPDVVSKTSMKVDLISKNFVAYLSTCDSIFDEVSGLISILSSHALNRAVPKDLLVDGVSIEYFMDNKLPKPENSVCDIIEESMGE